LWMPVESHNECTAICHPTSLDSIASDRKAPLDDHGYRI